LQNYTQRLLCDAVNAIKCEFNPESETEVQSNICGVVAYALGIHNGGQKLKQFRSKDGVKVMKAFKKEAQDILTAIHQQLRGFDHIRFAKVAPDIGIEPMSSEEFYQFVNLFFRRGLYWEPPHPALVNLTFPDLALRKKPKVESEENNEVQSSNLTVDMQVKAEQPDEGQAAYDPKKTIYSM
jgi:hypothetical protein